MHTPDDWLKRHQILDSITGRAETFFYRYKCDQGKDKRTWHDVHVWLEKTLAGKFTNDLEVLSKSDEKILSLLKEAIENTKEQAETEAGNQSAPSYNYTETVSGSGQSPLQDMKDFERIQRMRAETDLLKQMTKNAKKGSSKPFDWP